jgi:hypothetical protein
MGCANSEVDRIHRHPVPSGGVLRWLGRALAAARACLVLVGLALDIRRRHEPRMV